MRKTALVLLSTLAAGACRTTVAPIEIDLSKRTPAAESSPTPTPARTKERSAPTPAPAAAPGPESAAAAPAPPVAATRSPSPLAPASADSAARVTPEAIVEAQLAAYNRRDVEAFVASYAADAVIYDPPDRIRAGGVKSIRKAYGKAFADAPSARATITQRLVEGNFVVDHESLTGLSDGRSAKAIVVYEVRDGKIRRVWILR